MKRLCILSFCLFVAALTSPRASAQDMPCTDTTPAPADFHYDGSACKVLTPGQFTATPFPDAVCTGNPPSCANGRCQGTPPVCPYNDPDQNVVSLYGAFGNTETTGAALAHKQQGVTLSGNIKPRCTDGTLTCQGGLPPAIVFLFIGFSNTDIEIGGGNMDAWQDDTDMHSQLLGLSGQPCATLTPNPENPQDLNEPPWNQVTNDSVTQQSFLYMVYPKGGPSLVGPHVAVFNGAYGNQTLDTWDPTSMGFYNSHQCPFLNLGNAGPECNYDRVHNDLQANGYSDLQVQAIFLKSADGRPVCDLQGTYYCPSMPPNTKDAYQAEMYMGDIMRYLKQGLPQQLIAARYPNLQQVFVTSRIYGGYANGQVGSGTAYGECLNPEPFAYEEGFAVQRLIVAQITGTPDSYSGAVDYTQAPWFDWGPYLWADGPNVSPSTGLFWCNAQQNIPRCATVQDVRFGDLNPLEPQYWGDFTHPTASAQQKVASSLVNFLQNPWLTPWIGK